MNRNYLLHYISLCDSSCTKPYSSKQMTSVLPRDIKELYSCTPFRLVIQALPSQSVATCSRAAGVLKCNVAVLQVR
jgi:hypothetical protein